MLTKLSLFSPVLVAAVWLLPAKMLAAPPVATHAPGWLTQPLSVKEAIDVALRQNSAILKSQADLEAAHGVVVQTLAIALPKVTLGNNYQFTDQGAIEQFPFPGSFQQPDQKWSARLQLTQSVYEGGRIQSARRVAALTREQALLQHETVVADTVLAVREAYDAALLAAEKILVQESSVELLKKELEDNRRRFEAGTVPRFNVLRAEVELANAQPRLIRARNAQRLARHQLTHLLGYSLPGGLGEEVPLRLTTRLAAEPLTLDASTALRRALEQRTELAGLRKAERLRQEAIVSARAGGRPSAQIFAGAGSRSTSFGQSLTRDVSGWDVGWQLNWSLFDGRLTQGKVQEATAQRQRVLVEIDEVARRIELDLRLAHSNFTEAREVLESQKKVQEQADEALRLARARAEAGTGTQLEVLNAQTALTEARSTQAQALHDYSVARARLERAMGEWHAPAKP